MKVCSSPQTFLFDLTLSLVLSEMPRHQCLVAALEQTVLVKSLRPQPLPSKMVAIDLFVLLYWGWRQASLLGCGGNTPRSSLLSGLLLSMPLHCNAEDAQDCNGIHHSNLHCCTDYWAMGRAHPSEESSGKGGAGARMGSAATARGSPAPTPTMCFRLCYACDSCKYLQRLCLSQFIL